MAQATDAVWLPVLPDMSGFGKGIIKGAGSEADSSGKAVGGRFGKAMLAGVAVVAGGAALATKSLYSIGETFDDVTDTIRVGTGATGDALDGLVESAKNVGRNVPAEFEQVGTVVADINTRMGLSGETLEKVASQYLEAGRILGEEVDIAKTSAAFNAFQIEGEDVSGALDHLFRVSQATGVGMNDLAASVQANAPAVQQLGFSFEETASLVGNLDKAGLNSSRMMMGMSQALVRLAKDGEAPADAFQRTVGEIEGFLAAGDQAAAIDLAGKVFGTRNATQFIGAIESGTLALDDLSSVAGMTEDTILGAGEETMDFAERWQMFKNDVLVRLEPIASRVFGFFGTAMEQITQGVTAFGAAWTYNDGEITSSGLPGVMERIGYGARQAFDYLQPKLQAVGGYVTGTLVPGFRNFAGWLQQNQAWLIPIAAGILAMVGAWKTYQITMRVVQAVTRGYAAVQAALNVVMAMNPIGIVVLALVGLAAAFAVAWNRSETFRNVVTAAWEGIKGAASAAWNWLKGAFQWIKDGIGSVGDWFTRKGAQISTAWNVVKAALAAGWTWIKVNVFAPIRLGIEAVRMAFRAAGDGISLAWNVMKNALRVGWAWIDNHVFAPFGRGLDRVVGWVRTAKDNIGRAWDGLKQLFMAPINWVIRQVWNGGIVRVFNAVADVIPGVSRMRNQPEIVARAKGGYTPPGWTLVGEEGPELVNFTHPNRVYTADETRAMLAGQAPNPVQRGFSSSNPPHGGVGSWFGDRWEDVKSAGRWVADGVRDAAGNVVSWARGSLARAAGIILDPVKTLIGSTLGATGGRFGELAGGMATNAIDNVLAWVAGHDEGAAPDAGGRSLRGAQPHVNNAAHALADAVGGIRQMQAFNQSMAGGHPRGLAVDFIDSVSKLDRLAGIISSGGHFDNFNYMAWQARMWSPDRGWRPQGRGYGNDPMHRWHLHAEWYDQGGMLKPGMGMYANATGGPEPVLTQSQWRDVSTLAARGAGAGVPTHMTVRVGEREFEGYVEDITDGRISVADVAASRGLRQLTGRP